MKVALVHDYLREYGGAEKVVEALHEAFPEAPLYTAYYNPKGLGIHADKFKNWQIHTSWLQYMPFANKFISPFRIFAPKIFEGFDLKEYDVVISSCNVYFSKAVKVRNGALHISYIHTPPRYLYGYATSYNYKKHWWTRIGGEVINHFLRITDFEVSQNPNILVANSENVKNRIAKFYRRDSTVIYPPVEVSSKQQVVSSKGKNNYYLSVSRLVRGKGVDTIIEACGKLGLPLKVVGTGPEMDSLKCKVQREKCKDIEFLGQVDDTKLAELYANAKALIVASEDEDFGITAIEAMSAGIPVIAPRSGGYLESVVEGKTGEFFGIQSSEFRMQNVNNGYKSLEEVLENFDPKKYKAEDCIKQAEKFSKERFKENILRLVKENIK